MPVLNLTTKTHARLKRLAVKLGQPMTKVGDDLVLESVARKEAQIKSEKKP